jgi:hypothetical protein
VDTLEMFLKANREALEQANLWLEKLRADGVPNEPIAKQFHLGLVELYERAAADSAKNIAEIEDFKRSRSA